MKKGIHLLLHILFWILNIFILKQFLVFDESVSNLIIKNGKRVITSAGSRQADITAWFWTGILFKIVFCYLSIFWIYQRMYHKEQIKRILSLVLLTLLLTYVFEQLFFIFIFPLLTFTRPDPFVYTLLKSGIFLYLLHLLYVILYISISQWIKSEKQKVLLREEKHIAEIQFLKAQMDPHFLFNTLNNLYSLAQPNADPDVAAAILKLSEFMRYVIYRGNEQKVLLNDEISCIKNYIDLQKLKFEKNDPAEININSKGNPESIFLYPLLLIPFIENAFKHGFKPGSLFFLSIDIHIRQHELVYVVQNSNYKRQNGKDGGVGNTNLKRRLELLYPQKHSLQYIETDSKFTAQLTIAII
jgi:two-component system LytT family sensor kinase